MPKIIIVSDLHLGSPVSRVNQILEVLDIPCDKLIINGDLFDSMNLKRLTSSHWKILSKIRKLTKIIPVIFIQGNHDGKVEFLSDLLGMEVVKDYTLIWNNQTIFVTHGHCFDGWVAKQALSDFFTGLYYLIQRIDGRERQISTWLKLKSKQIIKTHKHLEERAIKFAKLHKYDIICVGHSHLEAKIEKDGILYVNSGSFCEIPCHYIEINDTNILLKCI